MNKGLNYRLKIKFFSIFPTLFCNKKACLQTGSQQICVAEWIVLVQRDVNLQ